VAPQIAGSTFTTFAIRIMLFQVLLMVKTQKIMEIDAKNVAPPVHIARKIFVTGPKLLIANYVLIWFMTGVLGF
jgi:hypothetical protein